MNDLIARLEASYLSRIIDTAGRKRAWRDLSLTYPPSSKAFPESGPSPSSIIARNAGDLGLALIWIVQYALIHCLSADLSRSGSSEHLSTLIGGLSAKHRIGALAHSEDPSLPVTFEDTAEGTVLTGTKNYITGGMECDFILLTSRAKGQEKISRLYGIPGEMLPKGALVEINPDMLGTAGHARLVTDGMLLPRGCLISDDGPLIRRLIRKWGIIERSLIMESYISLCLYLVCRMDSLDITGVPDRQLLEKILHNQRISTARLISLAEKNEPLSSGNPVPGNLLEIVREIENIPAHSGATLPSDLLARIKDLKLHRLFS